MTTTPSSTPPAGEASRRRFWRLGKEMIWVGAGQAVAVLGGIAGVRWLTGLLSPAGYGELALGMTVAALVQQVILALPAQAALRYYASSAEGERLPDFLAALRGMFWRCTGAYFLCAAALLPSLWLLGRSRLFPLALASIVFAYLWGAASVLDSIQNAARRRAVVAWHQGLGQLARVLLAVALISLLHGSFIHGYGAGASTAAMSGYVLAGVAVLLSQYWFFQRMIWPKGRPKHRPKNRAITGAQHSLPNPGQIAAAMWSYSWPFAIWGVFTWAQSVSDRWALEAFGSTADVGLYQPLYLVGYYPVLLLSTFAMQLISPVTFARSGDGTVAARVESARKLNRSLLFVCGAITLAMLLTVGLFHDLLFRILVAPGYRAVSGYLPWMVLAGGLFACGQMAALDAMSRGDTRALIAPKVGAALFGIGINIAGAYYGGLRGVVFANVAFGLVYLTAMLRTMAGGTKGRLC